MVVQLHLFLTSELDEVVDKLRSPAAEAALESLWAFWGKETPLGPARN